MCSYSVCYSLAIEDREYVFFFFRHYHLHHCNKQNASCKYGLMVIFFVQPVVVDFTLESPRTIHPIIFAFLYSLRLESVLTLL